MNMFKPLLASLIIYMISYVLAIISFIISSKQTSSREKLSPFECGFDSLASSRLPFSIRFFIIAIIFLVFDVEISLILPISAYFHTFVTPVWFIMFLTSLIILWVGAVLEWASSSLSWKL